MGPPFWIGDRLFTPEDIELIRWTTDRFEGLSQTELASTICENLLWKAPNGRLRVHEVYRFWSNWHRPGW
ncbi:Hypothetical protein DEACI_1553 [Acididesulfobacillus acetoxydans]|uniref:Uncharacterized protein n=1 Tax=Acididesulfobacillus acetoxydans TaxID=1561005 RepID=A0A8S0X4M1_9FIRM|nr:hypothetical protein [Acididesulfobacillus acetoxydans]CAA7600900.1 Hypothetical protein DEACI_1553 [Acididesulfobacillus acetoxydans]CEJ08943.1 Hypothetical protein DEACI_3425 [Acididesulfobacillus acetoxydans]